MDRPGPSGSQRNSSATDYKKISSTVGIRAHEAKIL